MKKLLKMKKSIKNWWKNEDSQITSETGMLMALIIFVVIVLGSVLWPKLKEGYENIVDRFVAASKEGNTTNWTP